MNEEARHSEYLDLIVRNLSGELSEEEQSILKNWLSSKEDNQKVYDEYSKVWGEMDKVKGKTSTDVDTEWERLEQAIDEQPSLNKPASRSNYFMRIAAVIVLFISVGAVIFFLMNQNQQEEVVAQNTVEEIELPEGSLVSLNLDSKLTFDKTFKSEIREVELQGEAFFEVARDTARPFVIKTGNVYVEVLGTAFNVKAYEDDDMVEVTVESGKVAVYRVGNKDDMVILVRGEKAVFKKELAELKSMDNDNLNYSSWKTRKIIFEDTPMVEVVRIINEIYQSNIQLSGSATNECPVTTEFDNQSLDIILNVLSSTLNLEVSKEDGQIIISGEGC